MEWVTKAFEDLTLRELYGILKLRSQVFIAEQGGRYQDPDDIDQNSLHIFCRDDCGAIVGCVRIFPRDREPGTVQLGRLAVASGLRQQGVGRRLVEMSLELARQRWGAEQVYLTGRKSALGFYLRCGFCPDAPEKLAGSVPYYELRRRI